MSYDLVITNAKVVLPGGVEVTDVAVRGETIAAVGPGLAGLSEAVVDGSGKYLIPGGVRHRVVTLDQPTKAIDIFTPVREEYR